MFEKIDFSPGVISYNDFNIDPNVPFDEENDSLKEDMFQVEDPYNYTIDMGWYSGVKKFILFIIKDCNWEEPIFKGMYTNLKDLETGLKESVQKVRELIALEQL